MVFLDTVGLIALWEQGDQWHEPASKAMAALDSPQVRLITTSLVLLECGNAAAKKPYRADVESLRRSMQRDSRLIEPLPADIDAAWEAYRRSDYAAAGIIDQISIIIMRRLNVIDAFTNDRHFKAAGLNTLF
jgi:predicted nucleic acid-binding protein